MNSNSIEIEDKTSSCLTPRLPKERLYIGIYVGSYIDEDISILNFYNIHDYETGIQVIDSYEMLVVEEWKCDPGDVVVFSAKTFNLDDYIDEWAFMDETYCKTVRNIFIGSKSVRLLASDLKS